MNSDIFSILNMLREDYEIKDIQIKQNFGSKKVKRTKGKRDKSLKIRANRRK